MNKKSPQAINGKESMADNESSQPKTSNTNQEQKSNSDKTSKFPHIKTKTLKRLMIVSVAICCLAAFVYLGFVAYFFFFVDVEVEYSNLSSNSVSVTWVSEVDQPGMAVAYKEQPGSIQIGKEGDFMAYDDRDHASAEEMAAKKLQEAVLEDPELEAQAQSEIEVKNMGRYKVHHVTFRDLEPNTQYYVLVGDGSLFKSPTTEAFTTRTTNDKLEVPSPAYGTVVKDNSGNVLQDGVLRLYITDKDLKTISEPISAALSDTGTWYVDLSSLYTTEGERFFDNYSKEEFEDMYEMHEVVTSEGVYQLNISTKEDAPAPEFILDQATMLTFGSLDPVPSFNAFLSNASAYGDVKGLIAMPDEGDVDTYSPDEDEEEEDDPYAGQVEWENEKADNIRNPSGYSYVKYDNVTEDGDELQKPADWEDSAKVDNPNSGGYRVITYDEDGNPVGPTADIGNNIGTDDSAGGPEEGAGNVATQEEEVEPPPPRYMCCARDAYNTYTGDRNDPEISSPAQSCLPGYIQLKEADDPGVCKGFWDANASDLQEEIDQIGYAYDPDQYAGECCTEDNTNIWASGVSDGYCQTGGWDVWDPDGPGKYTHTASEAICLGGSDDASEVGETNENSEVTGACCINGGTYYWNRDDGPCSDKGHSYAVGVSNYRSCIEKNTISATPAEPLPPGVARCTPETKPSGSYCDSDCSGRCNGVCEGDYKVVDPDIVGVGDILWYWTCNEEVEEGGGDDNSVRCNESIASSRGGSCTPGCGGCADASEKCVSQKYLPVDYDEPLTYFKCVETETNGDCETIAPLHGGVCSPNDCPDNTEAQKEYAVIGSQGAYIYRCTEKEEEQEREPATCTEEFAQKYQGVCSPSECQGNTTAVKKTVTTGGVFEYVDIYQCVRNQKPGTDGRVYDTSSQCNSYCKDAETWDAMCVRLSDDFQHLKTVIEGSDDYRKYCVNNNGDTICDRSSTTSKEFKVYFRKFRCQYELVQSSVDAQDGGFISDLRDSVVRIKDLFVSKISAQEENEIREDQILYVPEKQAYIFEKEGRYLFEYNDRVYNVKISGNEGTYLIFIDVDGDGAYDQERDQLITDDPAIIGLRKAADSTEYEFKRGFNLVSFNFLVDEYEPVSSKFLAGLNQDYGDVFYSISKYQSGSWQITGSRDGTTYGSNDFQIVPGVGYLIKAKKDVIIDLSGVGIATPVPVSFVSGWNLTAVHGSEEFYTADSLLDSINEQSITTDNVSRWDTSTGSFDGYQKEGTGENDGQSYGFDFPIFEQSAYFVRVVNGEGRWTP